MNKSIRSIAIVLAFALPTVMFARDPMGCNPAPKPQAISTGALNTLVLAISALSGR